MKVTGLMRLAIMAWLCAAAPKGRAENQPPDGFFAWTNMSDATRYHIEQTEYLLQRGMLDDASLELQQALSLLPDHPTLLGWAVDLYMDREQYALAEGYCARLAELFPSNSWVQSRWGDALSRMGRFDQAEKPLRRSLEIDSTDLVARYRLACLYLLNRQPSEAQLLFQDLDLEDIRRLAEWIREERDALPLRIGSEPLRMLCRLILTGRADPADNAADPAGPEEWVNRVALQADTLRKAQQYMSAKQWSEAQGYLANALAAGLQRPQARRDYARILYLLGEKTRALEEFQQLYRNHPDLPGMKQIYGVLLLDEGRYEEAAGVLAEAWAREPNQPRIAFALIAAHSVQRQYTDARDVARALTPDHAGQIGAWLREGHPYRRYLAANPELIDWLQSRRPAGAAE